MKIIYDVVKEDNFEKFIKDVNHYIKQGYELIGSFQVVGIDRADFRYFQPVILKQKENKYYE